MILDAIGGYDEKVITNFNNVAKHFTDSELLELILSSYCDDADIIGITEHLENRLKENGIK